MPHYVTLLFDVEDLCWPGSDDIVLDLAAILMRQDAPATFFVVGEKARLWQQRGRTDVIASLAPFDIASHTDLHSVHPTLTEYLAACGWQDGVMEALRHEQPAFETIEQIWGRPASSWGQAGGTWGPQLHGALVAAGIPCAVYPLTYTATSDVHWYAGALTFSGADLVFFDRDMLQKESFDACMANLQTVLERRIAGGQSWTGIFVCHPTMLRATQFWDQLNFAAGRNTEPADYRMPELHPEASYRLALQHFETLVRTLHDDGRVELTTIDALRETYRAPEQRVSLEMILEAARQFTAAGDDLPTDNIELSPAEAVYAMARALLENHAGSIERRAVGGPIEEPPTGGPGRISRAQLEAGCRELCEMVERDGHLPAGIMIEHGPVGIGTLGRAMARALLARETGDEAAELLLPRGRQVPAIAGTIASEIEAGFAGWPVHDPSIDPTRVLLHTRLQCWTLRPARPSVVP